MKTHFILSAAVFTFTFIPGAFAFDLSAITGSKSPAAEAKPENPAMSADAIQKQLNQSIADAQKSLGGGSPELTDLLNNIKNEAGKGENLSMVQDLGGLTNLPAGTVLTPAQKQILGEVKAHSQALALSRSFADDPELHGPVTQAIKAVQSGDHVAAATNLKTIYDQGSLSPVQKQILQSMLGDYGGYLDKASKAGDAVNALKGMF